MGSTGTGELFCSVMFCALFILNEVLANNIQHNAIGRELLFLAGIYLFSSTDAIICAHFPYLNGISVICPRPTDPAKVTAQADDGMAPVEDQRREECAHSGRVGKRHIGQE